MELYIDLLQKGKKSKYKVFLGIIFIVLGVTYFVAKVHMDPIRTFVDWLFFIFFILFGIILLFQGIGNPLESKIGKAYISVDEQNICIKHTLISKEVVYSWNEIKTIRFGKDRFLINDDEILTDPEEINKEKFQELVDFISKIAFEKGIEV